MADLISSALELFAEHCAHQDHALCGGSRECEQLQADRLRALERARVARQFDAGHERWALASQQPAHDWTTTALLRTASDLLLTPPERNRLWRSTAITTALARLGERGLPADVMVRTGMGPGLIRKILSDVAFFWSAARGGHVAPRRTPVILRPWCALLDAEPALATVSSPSPGHVLSVALAGGPGSAATRWIRSAAVGHIVGWRIDDYLEVDRVPEDLVLSGGRDSTRWVFDRFTSTFPDDWRTSSLNWELVYNQDPAAVASFVGVPVGLLDERIVTDDALRKALSHKLTSALEAGDELEGGLNADAVIAALGSMLEQGLVEGARAMARRLHEEHPRDTHLAMAYAFCSIPISRREACSIMDRLSVPEGSIQAVVREVNRATCAIFDGDLSAARRLVDAVGAPATNEHLWLWDPQAALAGRAEIVCEPFSQWRGRLDAKEQNQSR